MEKPKIEECATHTNIAETLSREMKEPVEILSAPDSHVKRVALPPGWTVKEQDDEKLLPVPRRKTAKAQLYDTESFVQYIKRHGSLTASSIWCRAEYTKGSVSFVAIINDHGEEENQPAWRDHVATFTPEFSEEWRRWNAKNRHVFTQVDFAAFIEENLKDVVGVDGSASGAQMLEMALSFEAKQDMRFKSAIRLSNGGVQMSFVQDDDAATLQQMQVFDRFSIGLPVFWGGDAYQLDARLRYRVKDGKLTFWFELIRQDKVLEAAALKLIQSIREQTGNPFFFGEPGIYI